MTRSRTDIYFETVKALERRAAALQKITLNARSADPLEAVLLSALKQILEVVGADAGTLLLANNDTGVFDIPAAHWSSLTGSDAGARDKAIKALQVKLTEGIVGQVFQTREPASLPDVSKNAVFRKDLAAALNYDVQNLLAVPLQAEDEPIGVLELFNKKPKGVFSAVDMEMAVALGAQVALLIELARKRVLPPAAKPVPPPPPPPPPPPAPAVDSTELQDARRSARDAQAQTAEVRKLLDAALQVQEQNVKRLKELSEENDRLKSLNEAATPPQQMMRLLKSVEPFAFTVSHEKALKNFMELAARLLGAQAVQVFLWDARTERLSLAMTTATAVGKGMALPFRKGEGVAGAAAESKEVIRVTDVARDDRFSKTIDEPPGMLARTLLVAPLVAQGKLLGVIEAVNKKSGGSFLEEDIVGLGGLAMMGGAALEKTLQFREALETHRTVLGLVADVIDARATTDLGRHERVRKMVALLGETLGLKENELRDAEWGALLYSIGRVTLPPDLALKKGELTPAERDTWTQVPRQSAEVLASVPPLTEAARVVRHVFERWDGQGSPDRLSTGEIPYGSRLLAVVNAFDGLMNGGAGAKALPPEVALKEIEGAAGKMFDPACVEAFARLWRAGRFKLAMARGR